MTLTGRDQQDLQLSIRQLLDDRFEEVDILSVSIANGSDDDLDGGIEITVVFRGTVDQLVRGRPDDMLEVVEDLLRRIRPTAFPVLNFISAS